MLTPSVKEITAPPAHRRVLVTVVDDEPADDDRDRERARRAAEIAEAPTPAGR